MKGLNHRTTTSNKHEKGSELSVRSEGSTHSQTEKHSQENCNEEQSLRMLSLQIGSRGSSQHEVNAPESFKLAEFGYSRAQSMINMNHMVNQGPT